MADRGVSESATTDRAAGAPPVTGMFDFQGILAIADSLPVMIAYVDRSQVYRFLNQPIADWFERPRSDILGRDMRDVLGKANYALRKKAIEAALGGERTLFAAAFSHSTRGTLTTQAEYIPHRVDDGSVVGVIMIIQDVTEQRATELALRESEARFRRIADSAPLPMWVTRLDRTRDFVNEAYAEFCGMSREQAASRDWRDWIHPDDFERIVAESIAGEASQEPFALEARYRSADGDFRWLKSVSQPRFGPDGELIGFIGAAADITVAKQAEEELRRLVDERTADLRLAQDQLRQSQKMEALGQLTGGIAHDFNNLLTVVVGGLDLITKGIEDKKLLRYATNALSAAERGARLTAQLLAFSRVQQLEVKPTYVSPLVEGLRPLLRNVLGPGIEKRFDLDNSLIPVMADPTQLEVGVLNLAINARDAMPEGGTLSISSRLVRVADDPEMEPGDYIELAITDTGEGMPPEVAARAFEPFFTTKDVGKGTGLGLSMVYGMARQSGGTARLESEVGVGTTVKLYFQRADHDGVVPATGGRTGDELRRSRGGSTVLVIDDDDDVRSFVAATLADYGHTVAEAADGVSGIKRYAEIKPDLVIIDYVMPGLSGAEVAQRILANNPDQPILFVSGYSETEAIRSVAPNSMILAKPFRPAALDAAVREALAS